MRRKLFNTAMGSVFFLALACASVAVGQDKKESDETVSQRANLVSKIASALELAEEGRKSKSPELLLSAATLLRRLPPTTEGVATFEREIDGKPNTEKVEKPETGSLRDDSDKLLTEAKKLAKELKESGKMSAEEAAGIEALAKRAAEAPVERGAFGGPKVFQDVLPAKGTNSVTLPFVRGLPATIAVRGYGNTPIEATVWQGKTQVARYSGTVVQIRWLPAPGNGNQQFRITIKNLGPAVTAFQMFTN